MFFDMKMPSPTSTASWAPSPCLTSSSSDGAIARSSQKSLGDNLPFVLYGRIVSTGMTTSRPSQTAPRVDDLLTRACERAGLDDFGGDSWREGLNLLVDTVESAPGVNEGGRGDLYGQFCDAVCERLRMFS